MGGKNSFFNKAVTGAFTNSKYWTNPVGYWSGGGSSSNSNSSSGTALTPAPVPPPKPPTVEDAGKTAEELENKKRKAAGRESTVLTAGLGSGMNTTYSVNKPTLGA
jgi:hypothetical protein